MTSTQVGRWTYVFRAPEGAVQELMAALVEAGTEDREAA